MRDLAGGCTRRVGYDGESELMQRPTNGDSLPANGPLAVQQSGGHPVNYYPVPPGSYANQPVMPGAPPEKAWPTLTELVSALKRRLVLATFLGMLVGVATASAVWLAMPSGKHNVRALLHIKPLPSAVNNQETIGNFDDHKKTLQAMVKLRKVLDQALQDPRVARLNLVTTSDDPAQMLDESLTVSWPAPDLMAIGMTGNEYEEMRVLVDAVVKSFLEMAKTDENLASSNRRKLQDATLRELDEKIKARREAMERQRRAGGAAIDQVANSHLIQGLQAEVTRLSNDIYTAEREIGTLDIEIQSNQLMVKSLDTAPVDAADIEQAARNDPQVIEKQATVSLLDRRLAELLKQLAPGSPVVVEAEGKVKKAREELRSTVEGLRPVYEKAIRAAGKRRMEDKLAIDQVTLSNKRKNKEAMLTMRSEAQAKLKDLVASASEQKVEDDELKPLLEQKAMVLKQMVVDGSNSARDSRITPKEDAIVVLNQKLRQKVLVALGGFVGGTLLVMAAIGFLEWRSRRVDSVDQVINELGMRVIGTIPAFPSKQSLKSGDAAQNQNWRFVLNESVNSARTMLLHTAKTQNMQVLMVTSAMQGEGKTSLASQLATSMATAGLRTLILDCDLRNPSMHKLFDAQLTPGCSEVLCQEVDVSDAVQPTTVPNLWLIPAGQCSNRVIAALAQGHPLETLFNRLRGQFDFIVVDSCPVLPVADTLLVGQHVDGVVLSILQDISQLPKVQTTAERLTQLNIPLLGTVVNGIKPDVHAYGYNYVKQLPA